MAMPIEKDEGWRYVDLELDLAGFGITETPGARLPVSETEAALSGGAGRAVSVDGHTVEAAGGGGRVVSMPSTTPSLSTGWWWPPPRERRAPWWSTSRR